MTADEVKVSMHISKYAAYKLMLLTAFADHLNWICEEDNRRVNTGEFAIPYKWHENQGVPCLKVG